MELKDINILLAKHFVNETSPAEEIEVQAWIIQNKEEYLKLRIAWADVNTTALEHPYDPSNAWDTISNKLHLEKKPIYMHNWSIAAAAILIMSFCGFWYYFLNTVTAQTLTGEVKHVQLYDGSIVTLNENSSIAYKRRYFGKREINLKGEGFFEVKRDEEHPFVVDSDSLKVTVLGTSFYIKNSEKHKNVTVITGKVQVEVEHKSPLILLPGQALELENGVPIRKEIKANQFAWKTNTLIFNNTSLQQVFETLQKHYNIQIRITNRPKKWCTLTSEFKDLTIEQVLKELELLFGLKYSIVDNEIFITALNCKNE